jgi:hypothetical protein
MKSQSGQITIEAVLILTLLVSTIFSGTRVIKDQQLLSKLVEKPWQYLSGMIENGYWAPATAGKSKHPNQLGRHGSPQGDAP